MRVFTQSLWRAGLLPGFSGSSFMEDTTDVGDHRLPVRFLAVDVPSVETVGISQLPAVVAFFLLTSDSYQSRGFLLSYPIFRGPVF